MDKASPCNITHLPREMIEAIFYHHVNVNFRSRRPLLRTCKTWYTIATTYTQLWRRIALGHAKNIPAGTICCQNLASIANVVGRTGSATFILSIGELYLFGVQNFVEALGTNWLSRCQSLLISPLDDRGSTLDILSALFHNCHLDALEFLEISFENPHPGFQGFVRALMHQAETSAVNLRTICILHQGFRSSLNDTRWIMHILTGLSKLPHRINKLHLSGVVGTVHWALFSNLNDLGVETSANASSFVGIQTLPLLYLRLKGESLPNSIAAQVWNRLTRLTLIRLVEHTEVLTLTSLNSLILIGCRFSMEYIYAPRLNDITIRIDPYNGLRETYPSLQNATITPSIVHIDLQECEEDHDPEWTSYIEKDLTIFKQPFPFWSRVAELHLRAYDYPPLPIREALSGAPSQHCFPSLRCLTLFDLNHMPSSDSTPEAQEEHVSEPASEEVDGNASHTEFEVPTRSIPLVVTLKRYHEEDMMVEELRAIMVARIQNGWKPLERLEVGRQLCGSFNLRGESTRVHWIDCLQLREPRR